jgi:NADH:ubiquinone oxidoreductase subunit 4 (subunit M)
VAWGATAAGFGISLLALIDTVDVFLRAMQALFSGPLADSCSGFPELLPTEKLVVVPVTLLMVAIGIAPQFLLNIFNSTVVRMAQLFA